MIEEEQDLAEALIIEKDYDSWFPIKKKLDERDTDKLPSFQERQIWWCHLGVNVGYEVFGKGDGFTRPVLIIKRYGGLTFLAAPLTTPEAKYRNHVRINLEGRESTVLLDQLRTLDARRLVTLEGRLSLRQFKRVRVVLKREF